MSTRATLFRAAVFGLVFAFLLAVQGSAPADAAEEAEVIKIGSKQFTESVILGEMLRLLVEESGSDAEHLADLGGTQLIFGALERGEIQAYPEYTSTLVKVILHEEQVHREEDIRRVLAAKYGIHMSRRLGFNNNYACDEFMERPDGWPALKKAYGLPHTRTSSLEHNVSYRGVAAESLDVMDVYTTDAEIAYYHIRVLEDDLGFFPEYHAVVLYRSELEKDAKLVEALRALEGQIPTAGMAELNAKVAIDRRTETAVAAEFLKEELQRQIEVPEDTFAELLRRRFRKFLKNTWQHLFLVAVSLAAAIAIAVPLGVASHKYRRLGQVILGAVGVIQTVPSLALLVFMIPFFGLGAWPAIIALFLYSLLPIVRNTHSGLHDIPPNLSESALALGLPPLARLWRVELPIASRSILAGIKTAAVINVGTATIGALIGAGGYGEPILTGIRLNDNWLLLLQGAVPAALLALLIQALFGQAEKFLVSPGLEKPA